jgi:uracil phosphoribosyltransferase
MTASPTVRVSSHPLVAVALGRLRDAATPPPAFRAALDQLAALLLAEVTAGLPVERWTVATPLAPAAAARLAVPVAFVPVLRAGLGFLPAAQALVPEASVWHVGFYRDEATLQPVAYYERLPAIDPRTVCFILDPMLATGGSAVATVRLLRARGARDLRLVAVLAAPEGLARLHAEVPDVPVYVAAVDDHLNERGFIVPGLGDAGDRQFDT